MPEFFLQHFWAGSAAWAAIYVCDYALTVRCARLYRGVRHKTDFEGSSELNPRYQRDVEFITRLLVSSIMLVFVWRLAAQEEPEPYFYSFVLGAMILFGLKVNMNHLQNLFWLRAVSTDAVRGRIWCSRPLILRQTSIGWLVFSGLLIALFAFTHRSFVLGGGVSCLLYARRLSRQARVAAADPMI